MIHTYVLIYMCAASTLEKRLSRASPFKGTAPTISTEVHPPVLQADTAICFILPPEMAAHEIVGNVTVVQKVYANESWHPIKKSSMVPNSLRNS